MLGSAAVAWIEGDGNEISIHPLGNLILPPTFSE